VISIGAYAFDRCRRLSEITYEGTIEQWNSIEIGSYWHNYCIAKEVVCSNGSIQLEYYGVT
jgi:hypothetical protein